MLVDTHCHIFREYYDDIDAVIKRACESGVSKIIVNGCDLKSNVEVLDLIRKYDVVYGALGFQPQELENVSVDDLKFIEDHINDEKVIAVGEIGLDYYYDDSNRDKQLLFFKKQLEIAKKYNKPVIVHSRNSIQETYNILSEANVKGIIHCYSGSVEMALEFVKLGFSLGIGGVCTFKNAKNIVEVIKQIPIEYLLLETDAPYLAPVPYRGQRNEPSYISFVADRVCEIKGLEKQDFMNSMRAGFLRLFDKL